MYRYHYHNLAVVFQANIFFFLATQNPPQWTALPTQVHPVILYATLFTSRLLHFKTFLPPQTFQEPTPHPHPHPSKMQTGVPSMCNHTKAVKALQERRADAYYRLHAFFTPQFSGGGNDDAARAAQPLLQEVVGELHSEMAQISTEVRALETTLKANNTAPELHLAGLLRSLQNMEKTKLELTHTMYRSKATIAEYNRYGARDKDEWEANEEFSASDMEGKPAPFDEESEKVAALRKKHDRLVEDINDTLDLIEEMGEQ